MRHVYRKRKRGVIEEQRVRLLGPRSRRKQSRKQMPNHEIVEPHSWLMTKITDPPTPRLIRHCIQSFTRQMKHQRMKRIAQIGHRISPQIVNRRHARAEIRRSRQPSIEIQIVIGAPAQLESDQVSVLARYRIRPSEVTRVAP